MKDIYFVKKQGFGMMSLLAFAIFLNIYLMPVAHSEDISASCHSECSTISDCSNSDCFGSSVCKTLCSTYSTNQTCRTHGCYWTAACSGPKINSYRSNTCLGDAYRGSYDKCDKQKCNAACENDSDCDSFYLNNSTCFFGGNCEDSCSCAYSSQVCPEAGTIINETCYYGAYNMTSSCTATGCALSFANMSGNDLCNQTVGPQDTIGPVTSEVVVTPAFNNGTFNITAVVSDTKSPINSTEYFLSQGNDSMECGVSGSGVAFAISHDKLVENVSAVSVKFESQGANKVCLHAQDNSGNYGNCTCANFEVDIIPPAEEGNISFNSVSGNFEELICNTTPVLNMTFCDSRSGIMSAEYFLDNLVPGYGLNSLNAYNNSAGWQCSGFSGEINISSLADGLHNISSASAIDSLGNRGNYYFGANYSFVKDSKPPSTNMVFSSENYWNCSLIEANGNNLSQCLFVLNGTQAMLNATDLGLDSSGKFSGNMTTHYRLWTKINESENWTNATEGVYLKNQTFDINLDNNTQYLFEVWSEDICLFSEDHKFNLIIAVVPVCPDAQCKFGENSTTCPSDCPSGDTKGPSSVSSSSSGTGTSHHYGIGQWVPVNTSNSTINETVIPCQPNWTCGEWSDCLDGIKTRDCMDMNACTGEEVISPELISQCAVEATPLGVCGDGLCQTEYGENPVTCPADCLVQESNTAKNSIPTGNFLAAPGGILSALVLLVIIALASYLIYKNNKGMTKIKAKSIK